VNEVKYANFGQESHRRKLEGNDHSESNSINRILYDSIHISS